MSDLADALMPVVRALRARAIPYYVGGSVASSAHGEPRATFDVDLIAALDSSHVDGLLASLGHAYYANREAMTRAVRGPTIVQPDPPGHHVQGRHVRVEGPAVRCRRVRTRGTKALEEGGETVQVASKEDTVLAKLEWFQKGHGVSDRRWSDIAPSNNGSS